MYRITKYEKTNALTILSLNFYFVTLIFFSKVKKSLQECLSLEFLKKFRKTHVTI